MSTTSGWASSGTSMTGYNQPTSEEEQAGPSSGRQRSWPAPNHNSQYPAMASYSRPSAAPDIQLHTQNSTPRVRWNMFDLFDEDEQERRKKGKEVMPAHPIMNGPPPPWSYYPYGPGAYAPAGYPMMPAPPHFQPLPMPVHPFPGSSANMAKPPAQNVPPHNQWPGGNQRPYSRSGKNDSISSGHAVLTPSSEDLTMHLTMDLEEDLDDFLDELSRLTRLGHFTAAQALFQEHLQHHIDSPYVLVQYADLLLRQGDYKGVTLLKGDALYNDDAEESISEELRILRVDWDLIQTAAKTRTLATFINVPAVFEDAANIISTMTNDSYANGTTSSTEIHILSLMLLLTSFPALDSGWETNGRRGMHSFEHAVETPCLVRLHEILLRQGRIWDFHDCLVPTGNEHIGHIRDITHKIFGKDLIPSLEMMISQWTGSMHGYDASITLGLLSILTHLLLEPVRASEKECIGIFKLCLPLAISVAENDPSNLKSRPYLRVLLAKSRFAENASRQAMDALSFQLQSAQGVLFYRDVSRLPVYVPSGNENVQWTTPDHPQELKDPIKLILRSAIEMGDMETEALALCELIRLSKNPKDEFDMLCALQLDRQGDLDRYGNTLASKYLVSNTKESKEGLRISISQFLSMVPNTDCWALFAEWALNMLLYKLEERSPSSIKQSLERSHTNYKFMNGTLLQQISQKMPYLKDWVEQQIMDSTEHPPRSTASQDNIGSSQRRKSGKRRAKSSSAARTLKQPVVQQRRNSRGNDVWEINLPMSPKSDNTQPDQQDQQSLQGNASPRIHPLNSESPVTASKPGNRQGNSVVTVSRPMHHVHHASPHENDHGAADPPENTRHRDEIQLEAEIRKRLAREYDSKLAAEKFSQMKHREDRIALIEELKKEVDAIRKEAIEQAERKARVEAQERHEQMVWERRLRESQLEKEKAMKEAKAAEAEMDAKFEAEREKAIRETEKKIKEELEIRKTKEEEVRKAAAQALHHKMEAERKARAQAEAEKKYKEEVERKLATEKREVEKRAREAAERQAEEEATRRWAAEQAQKDIEAQSQIHFKDAIGRKFAIPFSEGRKWQTMRELIEAPFAYIDVIGPEVQAGHYDLIGPDGCIILPQTWDQIIQPGWDIRMEMWPMVPEAPGLRDPWEPALEASGVPPPPELPDPSADERVEVIEEQSRASSEYIYNDDDENEDISSGYGSDPGPQRRGPGKRIAHAFAALKSRFFRRRRRRSLATTLSTGSSLVDD